MTFLRPIFLTALILSLAACQSREEELKEQRSLGAELVEDKAAMAQGAGEAMKSHGKESATVLTEGIGNLIKGVAGGVDRAQSDFQLGLHEGAVSKSLSADRVVPVGTGGAEKHMKVYVKTVQAYKGDLQLRAFDSAGAEIGRSGKVSGEFEADDARYMEFSFDAATPMSRVAKFMLHAS